MAEDVVIPIVFPDYMIAVPSKKVDLPGFINQLGFKDFQTPTKLPELGHAGALFIKGATGLTKYYEYGRYDPPANKGLVQTVHVPDVKLTKSGAIDLASLKITLKFISHKSGQHGRVSGAYVEVPGKYTPMLAYASKRYLDNTNPKRPPYELTSNSCLHFMKGVVEAAGLSTPILIDPRPVSYIGEIRGDYPDLDYDPRTGVLTIEGVTK